MVAGVVIAEILIAEVYTEMWNAFSTDFRRLSTASFSGKSVDTTYYIWGRSVHTAVNSVTFAHIDLHRNGLKMASTRLKGIIFKIAKKKKSSFTLRKIVFFY